MQTANTKRMSRFQDSLLAMLFLFFSVTSPVNGRHENPLVELSTRAELVELAGYGEEKLSSVLVTGTLSCQACLDEQPESYALPVSGALVGISCKNGRKKMNRNWVQETTNEYGDFIIDLPSHLHAIPHMEIACFIKVLQLPTESLCKRSHMGSFKRIRLISNRKNIRTYTVGNMRMQQTPGCLKKKKHTDAQDTTW